MDEKMIQKMKEKIVKKVTDKDDIRLSALKKHLKK